MDHLVSIIMPTYNCGAFIGGSIRSALRQTYRNLELIIVDDASTDDTREVVESIEDGRIRYILLPENAGAAVARTRAIEEAKGDFIAFLDSDDLWERDKLEKQLAFMIEKNLHFSCTAYDQIDSAGKGLNVVIHPRKKTNYNGVLLSCPVGNSTVMYDVRALGKFEVPNIKKRNDDALWLKMLKKTEYIYGLDQVLAHYRIRQNSISSNKVELIKYHWKLYRDIEHLSIPRSAFHIICWVLIKLLRIK